MNPKLEFLGYGFSAEALAAAWQELEADLPARGSDCPFTLALLELALGLATPDDETELRRHIVGCAYCGPRFEAQRAAVRRSEAVRASAPGESLLGQVASLFQERRGARRKGVVGPVQRGTVRAVPELAADDAGRLVIDRVVSLPAQEGLPALNVYLQWTRLRPQAGAADGPWWVTLRLPAHERDPEHGNPESELKQLDGCQVPVTLHAPEQALSWALQPRLDWVPGQKELVSHPEPVPLDDPAAVTEIELGEPKKIDGPDAR